MRDKGRIWSEIGILGATLGNTLGDTQSRGFPSAKHCLYQLPILLLSLWLYFTLAHSVVQLYAQNSGSLNNFESLDLRPQAILGNELADSHSLESLEPLAQQWLQSIKTLMLTAGLPASLREASAQETALFQAIAELATHYGFASRLYSLDKINTMHSFSNNLEILIPAQLQNEAVTEQLQQQQIPSELWQQIYQSKREVLLLTPISGASTLDIITLLLFMAISAEQAPMLPVRLVFLGSELLPPELAQNQYLSSVGGYLANYPIGSRSFLHNYPLPLPYGVLYFYHLQQPLPESPNFPRLISWASTYLVNSLKTIAQGFNPFRSTDLWDSWNNRLKADFEAIAPSDSVQAQVDALSSAPYQIIYNGSQSQTPAKDALQLGQALQRVGLAYHFDSGLKLLRVLGYKALPQLLDPYIEKQWPIASLYQKVSAGMPESQLAQQVSGLALSLEQFLNIKLEQAIEEQHQIAIQKLQNREQDLLPQTVGRNYWLWNFQGMGLFLRNPQNQSLTRLSEQVSSWLLELDYTSERSILLLIFIAIGIFGLSSFSSHSQFRQLQVIHKMKPFQITVNVAFIFGLIASYTLLANEGLLFVLQWLSAPDSLLAGGPINDLASLGLAAAILLKINFALLFLYCAAIGLNLNKLLDIKILPYLSQCLAFGVIFLLLWLNFSLAVLGVYLFFLHVLYGILPKYRSKYTFIRLLQGFLNYSIIFLLFIPYFFLIFSLPLSEYELLELLSKRSLYHYSLTLVLFLPSLFLHFSQIQFHRQRYPKLYRSYLLRRAVFYATSIIFCGVVVLSVAWLTSRSTTSSENAEVAGGSSPAIPAVPALNLEEIYILPDISPPNTVGSNANKGTEGESELGHKILALQLGRPSEWRSKDWIHKSGGGSYSTWPNQDGHYVTSWGNRFQLPLSLEAIEILDPYLGDQTFLVQFFDNRLLLERKLNAEELLSLQLLGKELLRNNSTAIRQRYSSILQLQTACPLSYITADIRAQQLDLSFANFPFSIATRTANGLQSSSLLIGFYPPPKLSIELLLARQPQPYQFDYNIGLKIPDLPQQARLLQQGDPLALRLFPLLSKLSVRLERDETSQDDKRQAVDTPRLGRELKVGQDFEHIIQIRGLQRILEPR